MVAGEIRVKVSSTTSVELASVPVKEIKDA
jgi:hypothetical protein